MAGRWLLAARAEGARADGLAAGTRTPGYVTAADMIMSAGSADVAGEQLHFARQARYWVSLTTGPNPPDVVGNLPVRLRVVRFGTEYLVDFLVTRLP